MMYKLRLRTLLIVNIIKIVFSDICKFTFKIGALPFRYWPDIMCFLLIGWTVFGAVWWYTFLWDYDNRATPRDACYAWLSNKGLDGNLLKKYSASVLDRADK